MKKILAVAIIAAGTGIAAPMSTAGAGSNLCDSNRVCIYESNDYVGLLGQRSAGQKRVNVSSKAEDKMDSWENKTSTNARWYHKKTGDGGKCVNMLAKKQDNNINVIDSDELSSWATNGAC